MESRWQISGTPITADEADKLVELVLRQRLSGSQQIPVDNRTLTVGSIAQAIGAREEEVASLLGDLRSRKGSAKPRRPIPVSRSLAIIAGIYGCVAMGLYLCRHHSSSAYYGSYTYPGPTYYSGGYSVTPVSDATKGLRSHLPTGFGFRFRDYSHPGGRLLGQQADWAAAEKYYVDFVDKVSSSTPVTVKPNVRPEEIAGELATGDTLADQVSSPAYGADMPLSEGRLIRWDPLEVTVDGHTISTVVPSAKVADETLEKAVRDNVKQRIAKVMKLMRIRMDVAEPTELR
ncbi:MAG TPA: hypothetical protein VHE55_08965 [Fimbriimonadaceae bacterium]|nr:hypothetical protein [Fimbriimonadaceae bacterium]